MHARHVVAAAALLAVAGLASPRQNPAADEDRGPYPAVLVTTGANAPRVDAWQAGVKEFQPR